MYNYDRSPRVVNVIQCAAVQFAIKLFRLVLVLALVLPL